MSAKYNLPVLRTDLFNPIQQTFDAFFNDFFKDSTLASVKGKSGYPKLDIYQTDGAFSVEATVPDCDLEDITVEVIEGKHSYDDRFLKIGVKTETRNEDAHYHIKEFSRGYSERTVVLPNYVKGDPDAVLDKGVLKLKWKTDPPEPEKPNRKQIQIKQR